MDGQIQARMTASALAEAQLTVDDLWTRYYGAGGNLAAVELEAYLSGVLALAVVDRNLLAEAANELLESTSVTIRVPTDGSETEGLAAQDPLRQLGAAGAFLLSADEQEAERLAALHHTRLLDSVPEGRFDRYTQQARDYFRVSSSIIALLDDRRMFLKSVLGPVEQDLPRDVTFCHATIRGAGPLIVEDAHEDERFRTNPLVLGEPFIRFYAGHPLRGPGGWTIGTLCVMDQRPRTFSDDDAVFLRALAHSVEDEINT